MKNKTITIVLSVLAGFCFLISYLYKKETLRLILAITWILIGIGNIYDLYKKNKQKKVKR